MVRLFRHSLVLLGLALAFMAAPASAGIDEVFEKPSEKGPWGSMLEWALGTEGFGKSYALVIGISDYTGGFEPLRATKNDPVRMKDFLLDEAGFDHVHVLTDDKASKRRIAELLEDVFPELVGTDDRFLFYWSGHGTQPLDALSKPLGYLPLANSGKRQFSSMVSMDDLTRWDRRIAAKHALFLLDACFSGLAGNEAKNTLQDFTIARLSKPAHHLITAGTGKEQAIAHSRWQGSLFTDTIIKAARGAADAQNDFPRDGVVNLAELMAYTRQQIHHERVKANWTETITPQWNHLRSNQGEFFFVTSAKKREVARVGDDIEIEHGMPVVLLGPGENTPINVRCDAEADRLFWDSVKDETVPAFFQAYLEKVESGELCGQFSTLATLKLKRLEQEPAAGPANAPAALSRERVIQIQEMLSELGFDPGTIDGDFGPRTRSAVIAFQRSIGATATGSITEEDEVALATAYADLRARRLEEIAKQDRGSTGGGFGDLAPGSTFQDCNDCPEMVVIPAGSFQMGSPDDEEGRYADEGPQHRVTLDAPFALGKYEVTRGQFSRFVAATGHEAKGCRYWDGDSVENDPNRSWRDPGYEQSNNHPVACVSWEDAQAYIDWLRKESGENYRLPSEAEWEYAARAGTMTRYFWGDDADEGCSFANGGDEKLKEATGWTHVLACNDGFYGTAPVGSFRSNAFDLYDISGNVWEWIEDLYHESYDGAPSDGSPWVEGNNSARVLRGGSWDDEPRLLRSAYRVWDEPGYRDFISGFRVARTLTP